MPPSLQINGMGRGGMDLRHLAGKPWITATATASWITGSGSGSGMVGHPLISF